MAALDADYSMDGGETMSQHLSIGIGCSARATVQDVIQLIKGCVSDMTPDSIIATLDRCSNVGEGVATALGLRLTLFSADVLAQVAGVTSHSVLAAETVGTSSVAEAAALASLGPMARLILPRQTGHFCTCAVAVLS
jgi:cobalt-precorrin 5A hydrolase